MSVKYGIRRVLASMGYDIRRIGGDLGEDPFRDMRRLVRAGRPAVIADVGANVGQSVVRFREVFDQAEIHAFEPDTAAFAELQKRTRGIPDLSVNNFALGPEAGERELIENIYPDMSSFLEPGRDGWGSVRERVPVRVRTLDDYCAEHRITHLDIVKTDTQGFDLEVLRGAHGLISHHRVHLIYMEVTFSELYKGLPGLDEIYGFLRRSGFSLVSFYQFHYRHDRAGWTDALFVDPEYAGAGEPAGDQEQRPPKGALDGTGAR